MNAQTDILRLITDSGPLRVQARRLYAAMIPEIAGTVRIPSPVAYPDEAQDVINRHALRLALALVGIAAERMNTDNFRANREHAANVAKLSAALLAGDEWSGRFARSCNDDDLAMVEDAGAKLRDAAEDIARGWGV